MAEQHIGILGAGLAGLTCADRLKKQGYRVTVFDKGRGVAGRMAVRRLDFSGQTTSPIKPQFDHGAQYFTARSPEFQQQVQCWLSEGVVAEWPGPFVTLSRGIQGPDPGNGDPRYVGTPGMNSLAKALAEGVQVHAGIQVTGLISAGQQWQVETVETQTGQPVRFQERFDSIVCTFPPAQALQILPEEVSFAIELKTARLGPCWCLLLGFETAIPVHFSAAFVQNSPLRWIAREQSKPGRSLFGLDCWVLHASPEWSRDHLEEAAETVTSLLQQAFAETLQQSLPQPVLTKTHRWRYAIPENPLNQGCLTDPEHHLIACGDWCDSARVEGAYQSGLAAADAIIHEQRA